MKIRWSPGNLDTVQVLDEIDGEWVELPSTSPLYTHNLSEWEHEVYRRAAKRRNEVFETQQDMLDSRAATLREIDEMAPKLPFQRRREMGALFVSESVKKLRGERDRKGQGLPALVEQQTAEGSRNDAGLPRTGSSVKDAGKAPNAPAPEREEGYYGLSEPDLTDQDWDLDDDEQRDPEIGEEERPDEDELPPEDDR